MILTDKWIIQLAIVVLERLAQEHEQVDPRSLVAENLRMSAQYIRRKNETM